MDAKIRISDGPIDKITTRNPRGLVKGTADCHGGYITPEDSDELGALLGLDTIHCQGVSIMASHDAYREYVDRAEGRTPRVIGVPYWD